MLSAMPGHGVVLCGGLSEGLWRKFGGFTHIFVLGLALVTNSPIPYVVVTLLIPVICGVVFFEERELKKGFGQEYEGYCQKVPKFFKRIKNLYLKNVKL